MSLQYSYLFNIFVFRFIECEISFQLLNLHPFEDDKQVSRSAFCGCNVATSRDRSARVELHLITKLVFV